MVEDGDAICASLLQLLLASVQVGVGLAVFGWLAKMQSAPLFWPVMQLTPIFWPWRACIEMRLYATVSIS